MKLYLVHGNTETKQLAKWVGTQADAAATRKAFMEEGAKRADLDTKEVDVPTDKAGLLEFLNKGEYK